MGSEICPLHAGEVVLFSEAEVPLYCLALLYFVTQPIVTQ